MVLMKGTAFWNLDPRYVL